MASLTPFLLGMLSRACLLLAFSEFIFFNEEPALALARAESPVAALAHLAEATAYYLMPGALLYLLEPHATNWRRTLLVGAFVGWSIEAAMVPVAYEAIPVSYFWTSVSWHAVIDVCLGIFVLRAALSWPLTRLVPLLVAIAVGWAVWSTWPWAEVKITAPEFALLVAGVVGLVLIGMALMRPAQVSPLGRVGTGVVLFVNLGMWTIWATAAPIAAGGLALLAALTGWALWLGRAPGAPQICVKQAVAPARYALLVAMGGLAWAVYAALVAFDLGADAELMVNGLALAGALWFLYALSVEIVAGLWRRIRG